MTVAAALKEARSCVSMNKLGDQWQVSVFTSRNLWEEGSPKSYYAALREKRGDIAMTALSLLYPLEQYEYEISNWIHHYDDSPAEEIVRSFCRKFSTTILVGYDAIAHAEATGLSTLEKYTDPTEEARTVTIEEAREIAKEDPTLIWVTA